LAPALEPAEVIGCPVEETLGLFGRKWAFLVIRDLTFYPDITFGQILRRNPTMTPRVLSMRLRELREEGLVEKLADASDDRVFHYRLTAKGRDAIPLMVALASYGLAHFSDRVFEDGRSRSLAELFPGRAVELLGPIYRYALADRPRGSR